MTCRSCPRPLTPEIDSGDGVRCVFCVSEGRGLGRLRLDAERMTNAPARLRTALENYNANRPHGSNGPIAEKACVVCRRVTAEYHKPYHAVCGRCQDRRVARGAGGLTSFDNNTIHAHTGPVVELSWKNYDDQPL